MHERNTIKLHVQVFLRMNTWIFETFAAAAISHYKPGEA